MPNYGPIQTYLDAEPQSSKELTFRFREIGRIIGHHLPDSAFTYRAWWSNERPFLNRTQAAAWLSVGFFVDDVNLDNESGWIRFKRSGSSVAIERGAAILQTRAKTRGRPKRGNA